MTPDELAALATDALAAGGNMTLVHNRGARRTLGFPRGKLLCENYGGGRVYSYDPQKILAWLNATGLVEATKVREEER